MKDIDNPPAFPIENNVYFTNGMTLLDYFAAKAMQGVMTSPEQYSFALSEINKTANFCYKIAQAMLKERQKHL